MDSSGKITINFSENFHVDPIDIKTFNYGEMFDVFLMSGSDKSEITAIFESDNSKLLDKRRLEGE